MICIKQTYVIVNSKHLFMFILNMKQSATNINVVMEHSFRIEAVIDLIIKPEVIC